MTEQPPKAKLFSVPERRETVAILFREKIVLLSLLAASVFASIAIAFLAATRYEARASLLVKSGREFRPISDLAQSTPGPEPYTTRQEIINSELSIITSREVAETTLQRIGISNFYPEVQSTELSRLELAIDKFLTKDLRVTPIVSSQIIEISLRNADREVAVRALNLFLETFQAKHTSVFGERRTDFFEARAGSYEERIRKLGDEISGIRTASSVYDPTEQRLQVLQERAASERDLRRLQMAFSEAAARETYYSNAVARSQPFVTQGVETSDAVEEAKVKLVTVESQLSLARQRFVDAGAKSVRDLETQATQLRGFIDGTSGISPSKEVSRRNPLLEQAELRLQSARAEKLTYAGQTRAAQEYIETLDKRLVSLEQAAKRLDELEREFNTLKALAASYRTKSEEARILEQFDRERMISVQVIDRPAASLTPVAPRRALIIAGGVIVGSILSIVYFLYCAFVRQSFINAESVQRLTGISSVVGVPHLRNV